MNNEIINSNESEKEKYYFVIGTSTIKDNIGEELYDGITKLFTRLQDYPKVHIIFVDVSNSFKQISFEEWYNDAFDGRSGIWIGENFALQTLISISDLDNQEKIIGCRALNQCSADLATKYKEDHHLSVFHIQNHASVLKESTLANRYI